MKPMYHASPIDPASSFVVMERGDERCDFVLRCSGMTTTILSFYNPRLGLKGEVLDVPISRKVPAMHPLSELRNQRTTFAVIMRAIAFHLPQFHPIPVCPCWANESWTRGWLGEDRRVLILHTYNPIDCH